MYWFPLLVKKKKKKKKQAKCCHDPVLQWVPRPFRIILWEDIETLNVAHPLGMLIFTHSLFLYPRPFFYFQRSLVTRNQRVHASPMVSLKLQCFTPFLSNVGLERLWFYCAHSYDFCRIYSCINTTYFFMTTYIPSMITVLSQLASLADIIRGSSRP